MQLKFRFRIGPYCLILLTEQSKIGYTYCTVLFQHCNTGKSYQIDYVRGEVRRVPQSHYDRWLDHPYTSLGALELEAQLSRDYGILLKDLTDIVFDVPKSDTLEYTDEELEEAYSKIK